MYNINKIREKLDRGEIVTIGNSLFADPSVSELMGFCGCDMIWIDMEHAAIDNKDVQQHILGAHSAGSAAIVRVPSNDPAVAKKVLDMGPDGILFPLVHSAQETQEAMRACLYPPDGIRGWNPIRAAEYGVVDGGWYKDHAEELLFKMIMMEHIDAVRDIDTILETRGLDAIMLGPCDLSGSMGKLTNIYAPDVQENIRLVVQKCREKGVYVGVALGCGAPPDLYRYWLDMGVQIISFGQDVNLLVQAVKSNLDNLEKAIQAK